MQNTYLIPPVYKSASLFTDPLCKAHELFRRFHLVDLTLPQATRVEKIFRKTLLFGGIVLSAFVAVLTTIPGIALRRFATYLQHQPFIHIKNGGPSKELPPDKTFTLLSWNVCCVAGGYAISDGGVTPWSSRIDRIIDKIVQTNADVNCLYETFDTNAAFYLAQKLKSRGYKHLYFNMGARAIGVSSGIFVASKYQIANPEFIPYPLNSLIGRTKNSTKGYFSFDLPFATIVATHLQHSEKPAFPLQKEREARKIQMELIQNKVETIHDRCVVVTGDLNLDDDEFRAASWQPLFTKGDDYQPNDATWGGDAFCARMVGKEISGPLNLDHTMILKNSADKLHTTLLETGFDGTKFKKEALSDHRPLFSRITVK